MAQRILGLDIGEQSICVSILESSIRALNLLKLDIEPIRDLAPAALPPQVPGTNPSAESPEPLGPDLAALRKKAVLEALNKLRERGSLDADHIVASLAGDAAFSRVLNFPFQDPKRIKQVLGFELESAIPYDVEDVILDHRILKTNDEGATVFAVAAPSHEVQSLLELLSDADIDPRIVSLDTFGFTKLLNTASEAQSSSTNDEGCIAIVDLGHARTDITIMLDGKLAFARTIRRGAKHVSRAVAKALNLPQDQAHRMLVAHGRLLKAAEIEQLKRNPSNEQARNAIVLDQAIRSGIAPVLRDINQTFRSHEQLHKEPVEKIYLAGGMANIRGTSELIHETLEVPCHNIAEIMDHVTDSVWEVSDASIYASSVGLALEMARGGSRASIDFRKGPFVFKSDFQYLAERGAHIAALLILCFTGLFGFYSVKKSNLEAERERLEENLAVITEQIVGVKLRDPDRAVQALSSEPKKSYLRALPARSAVWVYREVSKAITEVRQTQVVDPNAPPKDPTDSDDQGSTVSLSDYSIEIQDFDLSDAKGLLTGQVNNVDAGELFLAKLKLIECFSEVTFEETDIVSFARHRGWRIFKINFTIDCSKKKKESDSKDAQPVSALKKEPDTGASKASGKSPREGEAPSPKDGNVSGIKRKGAVLPTPPAPSKGGAR